MRVQVPPRTLLSCGSSGTGLGRLYRSALAGSGASTTDRRTSWPKSLQSSAPLTSIEPATSPRLAFKTTAELPELAETIGQARAVSSVAFGMGIHNDGYNIFAVGPTGTGKASTIHDFLSGQRRVPPSS